MELNRVTQSPVPPGTACERWENEGGSLPVTRPSNGHHLPAPDTAAWRDLVPTSDRLPVAMFITDGLGQCVYLNPACRQLLGAPSGSLLGKHWSVMIHASEGEDMRRRWRRRRRPDKAFQVENRMLQSGGQPVWLRQRIVRVDENEPEGAHIHTLEDVSALKSMQQARKSAEESLFEERARTRTTLDLVTDAVLGTDATGHVTYMNRLAERMTGCPDREARGRHVTEVCRIIEPSTQEMAANTAELSIKRNQVVSRTENTVLVSRSGLETIIEDAASPLRNRSGAITGAVNVFRDIQFSEAAIRTMRYRAMHDALTGLPNRATFEDRFCQALKSASRYPRRVGVMFIDVNDFKTLNDTFGHAFGDRVLAELATRLLRCLRASDTLCRYGGDEFTVLLSEISQPADTRLVARRMEQATALPLTIDGLDIDVSLSMGHSVYPDDGQDIASLLQKADTAMYRAKDSAYRKGVPANLPGHRPIERVGLSDVV